MNRRQRYWNLSFGWPNSIQKRCLSHPLQRGECRLVHTSRLASVTNVQQALAGLKAKLAADMVELIALCLIQRFVSSLEIGAGIHPLGAQSWAIKLVGSVVVKRNGSPVALFGVLARKSVCYALAQRVSPSELIASARRQVPRIAQQCQLVAPRKRQTFKMSLQSDCAVEVTLKI